MTGDPNFTIETVRFDEHYQPSDGTRLTTNFANLARGENRQRNLREVMRMIENRCNDLARWDNADGCRYGIVLDIVSVGLEIGGGGDAFPVIELLEPTMLDRDTGARIGGIVGNNFSSYVRDYDFSVRLPAYAANRAGSGVPDDFGDLHGMLFKRFVRSDAFRTRFRKLPVFCLSVSHDKFYRRTDNGHPILGTEYRVEQASLTDFYFGKMGLKVRYFMPPNGVAPLAFYFSGDLLNDYGNLELIGTIATMETFQKIYRPEIYNANSAAGARYRPSLQHQDHSSTRIVYDREERGRLAVQQGRFAEEHLIRPYRALLDEWSARHGA